ncbi:uncharacterized protein LOC110182182 [Drosophila serrata]|uniref:uncharacterized protein LOC110182182 n=1 Tax=Drosophila serrata TaxID=7274 RepID=UPI000A1D041A|nr:uncharacterized protein LOC110182182 [Drosophila serrata]
MAQLSQMTRYITNWLGWMPAATTNLDGCLSSSKNKDEDASFPQESSGFLTVMAIYLAMTIVLAAVNFYTANGKDKAIKEPKRFKNKRKLTSQQQEYQHQHQHQHPQQQQQLQRPWRYSSTGMALIRLIRQLGSPKCSRHQLRLRLRMRLRRHLEQELKLVRELEQKGSQLGQLGGQKAEEVNSSTYFDPHSDTEP